MKLFANCPRAHRLALAMTAATRGQLPHMLEITCPTHGQFSASRSSIVAETSEGQIGGGAVLGALVGLVAGPAGLMIGGALGAALGANAAEVDQTAVRRFNDSW